MSIPIDLAKIASNLREIERLATKAAVGEPDRLLTQAVHLGGDRLMPGGLAMVALAGTANLDEWEELRQAAEYRAEAKAERYGLNLDDVWPAMDDEDGWEPPLQSLRFWSEAWRRERDMTYADLAVTVRTEASFLRSSLDWALDNEPRFDNFAKDISDVRTRLETLLSDGDRPVMRGAPCLYDECRGQRLIRTTVLKSIKNPKTKEHVKTWVLTDWHCTRCRRSWTEDEYERNVFAAIHRERTVVIDIADPTIKTGWRTEIWCVAELAAQRVNRPPATVRVWLHRGQIAEACIIRGRRQRFVRLADVEARHQLALARTEKRAATIAARTSGRTTINQDECA